MFSNAFAQTSAGSQGQFGFLGSILPFVLMFAVIYFLMIRPQSRRQKETKKMLAALKVGDEVVTVSGLMGKIKHIDESTIKLKVAQNVEIKMQRQSVASLLPTGSSEI